MKCPLSISKTDIRKGMGIGFNVIKKKWCKWKVCKYEQIFADWVPVT
jgi:hypothetical protein